VGHHGRRRRDLKAELQGDYKGPLVEPRLKPAPGRTALLCPRCGVVRVRGIAAPPGESPIYECLSLRVVKKSAATTGRGCRWVKAEDKLNHIERLRLIASSLS
jgi:hypothetical protein